MNEWLISLSEYIGGMSDELDNAKAENAKLRDERDRMYKANVEKNGEILRLLEENARLKQELEAVGTAAYLYGRTDIADENAKLRKLASELYQQVLQDDAAWHDVRAWEDGLPSDCLHPIRSYDDSLGKHAVAPKFEQRMREWGIEVDE